MEDGEEETGEEEVTAENVGAVAVLADTAVAGQFKTLKRCILSRHYYFVNISYYLRYSDK
jgi:hypothetical protein